MNEQPAGFQAARLGVMNAPRECTVNIAARQSDLRPDPGELSAAQNPRETSLTCNY